MTRQTRRIPWTMRTAPMVVGAAVSTTVVTVGVEPQAASVAHVGPAYIDPGIGSYVLQILVGAFAGALFVSKLYWQKVKAFVQGLFGAADASAAESADERSERSSDSETTP